MAKRKTKVNGVERHNSNGAAPITFEAIRGRSFEPKKLIVRDFFGEGQNGFVYYRPVSSKSLLEMQEAQGTPEIARKLIHRLSETICNEDGTPMMTEDQWGELPLDRLMEVMNLITSALVGGEEAGQEGNA